MRDARTERFNRHADRAGIGLLRGKVFNGGWKMTGLSEDYQTVFLTRETGWVRRRTLPLGEAKRLALAEAIVNLRTNLRG